MAPRSSCDFRDRVFLKHKSKITGDCCVFNFMRRSVNGKHLMHFQIETSVYYYYYYYQLNTVVLAASV